MAMGEQNSFDHFAIELDKTGNMSNAFIESL